MQPSDDLLNSAAAIRNNKAPTLMEQGQASDALLDNLSSERKRRTDLVLDTVTKVNPDKAAEANKLSQQFGLDVPTVQKNQDEIARMARIKEAQALMQASPILARQMTDPKFAAIAQDDLDNMREIERTFTGTLGDIGVTVAKGVVGLPQAIVGLADIPTFGYAGKGVEAAGVRFDETQKILDSFYSPAQQRANKAVQQADGFFGTLGAALENPSVIGTTVVESLPQMLGGAGVARGLLQYGGKAVAAGVAGPALPGLLSRTLGSSAPLAAGALGEGTIAAGAAAEQVRAQNKDGLLSPKQVATSIATGAGTAGFSLLGGKIAQKLGVNDLDTALASGQISRDQVEKGLARQLAEAGVTEGVLEELPQSAQEQIWMNIATDRPVFEGVGEAAAMGMLAGAATGGGFQGVQYMANKRMQSAQRADQDFAAFQQLDQLAAANKVRQRDVDTFEKFVAQSTEDGPVQDVFINAQTLQQSGVAEALAEVSPAVREQLAAALAIGGDIRIPVAEYTARIAGTEYNQSLLEHLKTDPNGFSYSEAQEFMQNQSAELQAEVERMLAAKQVDDTFKASQDRVKQRVLGELNALGRFGADKNELDATLIAARSAVRAAQLGMTPEAFFEKQVLRVVAERMDGEQLEQGGAAVNTPEFQNWFGDSKVVDANGKPLVVYHGTARDFTEFTLGVGGKGGRADTRGVVFFTNSPTQAEFFGKMESRRSGEGERLLPVFLSMKNPLVHDFKGAEKDGDVSAGIIEKAKADGHDGVVFKNVRDAMDAPPADVYAVFNPTQIKSATGNRGTFDPNDANILNQSTADRDLIVTHNLTAANLLHAVKMGGIPVPSLAVTKKDTPLTGFGEITLIGDKNLADPKGYAGAKVFGADIYSPRYPSVTYEFTPSMKKGAEAKLKNGMVATDSRYIEWGEVEREGARELERNAAFMWTFLADRGIEPSVVRTEVKPLPTELAAFANDTRMKHELIADPAFVDAAWEAYTNMLAQAYGGDRAAAEVEVKADRARAEERGRSQIVSSYGDQVISYRRDLRDSGKVDSMATRNALQNQVRDAGLTNELETAAKSFIQDLAPNERIFQGFTNSGNRKYIPHTLENVVKILKKELRGGESFNYGVGSLRAKFTPQFKSVEQIRKAKDRLVSAEDFDKIKDEINTEFTNMADAMNIKTDTLTAIMEDAATMGVAKAAAQYDVNVDGDRSVRIAEFMTRLRELPTAYFEAKVLRDVSLAEFKGAVVPDNIDPKALAELRKNVEDIRTYKAGDETDRATKLGEFENLFFQSRIRQPGPRGSFSPSNNTITLLRAADLSTFLHESGHYFFESDITLAAELVAANSAFGDGTMTEGEQQIVNDVHALFTWHGLQGNIEEQLRTWYTMDFEEKRVMHERTAESFEVYLFEGRAPSIELQPYFQRFRAWLISVYRSIKDYVAANPEAGTLNAEIRAVFDRMIATTEQIALAEQARSMMPLFETAEQAGMTVQEFAAYQALGMEATQDAIEEVQARTLRDLAWTRNARGREIKKLQKRADALRREVQMDVRREVLSLPVYRAWQFLTGKGTPNAYSTIRTVDGQAEAKPAPAYIGVDGTPFAEGGQPFKTERAAKEARKLQANTRVVKVEGGFALVEKSEAQLEAEANAAKRLAIGTTSAKGMPEAAHEFLASKGGLSPATRSELGIDGNVRVGSRWLFAGKGKGLSIEQASMLLKEYGYTDTEDNNAALDLIRRSVTNPQYTAEGWERIAEIEREAAIDDEMPGLGLDIEATEVGKLDTPSLKGLGLPDEVVAALIERKMVDADGIHPDVVADAFGFTSGDEMARALAEATPPAEEIEALTDARMMESYGELATPEAIERAADMAIHNDARARFVATEANALAKATGQRKIMAAAAREFANTLIARLKLRDIKPGQYANAEARAAKAAEKASRSGDLPTAAAEKRNQLVQNYAAKAAYNAQDEVDKGLRYLRKFDSDGVRKSIDAEYADQIEALLERFDLRTGQSLKAIDKRTALAAWVESQREQGLEPDIPADLLNEAYRTSYKNLTVEEFRGLVDSVKQIEHLGRLKNRLLTAADNRAFDAVKEEIVASIEANSRGRTSDARTPTTNLGRWAQTMKNFYASHIKAATWARVMDGGQDGGPMWEYFIRSANERGNMETQKRADATVALTKIMAPVFKQGKMGGSGKFFPSIGRSLNREARIAIALNTGNAGNVQRLLGGEGWTVQQIAPVLQSLSAAEWRAVQSIWDHFESYRPEIGAKERRVYGKEPDWVDPQPFTVTTADGEQITLRGGYYPIKYDPAASQRAEEFADAEDAKRQMQGAFTSATTRRSFTKSRAEEVSGRPLLYTLAGMYSGVNDVIHDLAWHEWLIDANRLLRSQRIDQAIRTTYGPEVKQQFKSWVNDVAEGEKGAQNAAEAALGRLRQGVSAAGLGFNVMSAAIQITGFNQSIVRVGAKWIGRGIAQYVGSPIAKSREVVGKSTFMADRSRTQFRELNELRNQVQGQTAAMRAITLGAYFLMMRVQRMVDTPTWLGAYEKAIADGNDENRAIALADQAVIESQGSGMVKDLSRVERGAPALKLFTVYYSYMNTVFNMAVAQTMTTKSKAKLAADYLMLFTVPAVLGKVLKDALTPGGDDDDEDLEGLARSLAAEQLSYLMGTMVVVREFSEAAKIITGAEGARDYQGPAGVRVVGDTLKFITQAQQGEFDDAFRKASINLIGGLTGLPAAQINRSITGINAYLDGETDNPAAVLFGYQQ
jgi:hypothetical protein